MLYRVSDQHYDMAYEELKNIFSYASFIQQGDNPRADFKPLLLQCFLISSAEYIIFSVDDVIIKDCVDFNACIKAMENANAYCFYLRLGENITRQYGQDITIGTPAYTEVQKDILQFTVRDGSGDWAYAHNLDMTLYKKSDIVEFFVNADYSSPNTLESVWSGIVNLENYGLCFRESKIFTLPLNIIQQDWWVPNENSYSAQELFMRWQEGFIFDINQFYLINNDCALMGYKPQFISRNHQ